MEPHNVSIVGKSKMTVVQTSRKTTTTTSSSGHGDTMTSQTSQYNVRQIDSGPGGQVLDWKMEPDGQTGQSRVEMTFSVDPLQQPSADTQPVYTDSVTTTSSEVSKMASPPRVSESDRADIRYRQTTSVGGPSESPVQAVKAVRVATAPPSHDDVAVAGDGGGSRRLLDKVINTLNWNNDTRRDPIVIVVIITLLFLFVRHLLSSIDQVVGGLFTIYLLALVLALSPGIIKHKCVHKLCAQCAKLKNRLLKKE